MEQNRAIKYWQVLNEVSTRLQKAVHSETAVYETFSAEIIKHGLHGTVNWLDETGENLIIHKVVLPDVSNPLFHHVPQFLINNLAGYQFPLDKLPPCREATDTQAPVFIADNTAYMKNILPAPLRRFVAEIAKRFANMPAIFAPLYEAGTVTGVLYLAGKDLIETDMTAVQALASHLSIALENATLFQSLTESESRFRILAENVPGVIFLCQNDARFTMLYLNNEVENLTGYPKEMFLNDEISFVDLYHPDDADDVVIEDPDTLAKVGTFHHIYRIKHRNGEWRWVEEFGSGVYDDADHLLFLEGVISDITERKLSEKKMLELAENLETQKRFLDAIIETTPEEFIVQNESGVYLYASLGILRLWNMTLDELVGKSWRDVPIPERVGEMGERQQAQIFATGQPITQEISYDVPSGKIVVEYVVSPVFADDGKVLYTVTTIRDITQRKKEAEAMYHTQKMESLGLLAGGVAHDFNNLLVAMLTQTAIAERKLPSDSAAIPHIQKAVTAAESAGNLTRQLLAYSGRGQFILEQININQLIRDNVDLLEVIIPKNVTLQLSLWPNLPTIEADIGQIQQVVMNLIMNAAEAIGEDKSGVVELSTAKFTLFADDILVWRAYNESLQEGAFVTLRVYDNGIGLNPKALNKIFDPFYTTKFTGRGLGLAAVSGIVRGHNGSLRVMSEEGKGTTFELIFPIAKNQQVKDDFAMDTQLQNSNKCVLVIDDEEGVREAVTDILAMEDILVITAVNGTAGIALYQEQQENINVVLLDISMPGLSGEDTLKELLRINPEVKVILSSGYSDIDIVKRNADNKNINFLQKPYNLLQLLQEIGKYFQNEA